METITREAKLFEAASYPERGISFTETDLDAIIAGFKAEGSSVPVKVQHTDSPFNGMGKVIELYRKGKELFGKIEFPKIAWDFLCHMNAKRLSVGFDWRQRRLREVSIVHNPRVLTAQVFGATIGTDELMVFENPFEADRPERGANTMNEYSPEVQAAIKAAEERGRVAGAAEERTKVEAQFAPLVTENAVLKRTRASEQAAVKLAGYKAEGKLPPACEKYAEAILVDGTAEVTFSDGGHMSCADAFVQFMTHLPPVVEVKGERETNPETGATEAEKRIFSALGITEEEVKKAESGIEGEW